MVGPWPDSNLPIFTPDPVNRGHPLNQGRVAWWLALPDIIGGPKFYDIWGLWPGTLGTGASWGTPIRPGGWGQVSGDGAHKTAGCGNVLTGFTYSNLTVAAWMYRSATTQLNVCGWGDSSAGSRFEITKSTDGHTYFTVEPAGQPTYSNASDNTTGWHHYVLAYDGTQGTATNRVSAYIDGVKQTLSGFTGTYPTTYTVNQSFTIGSGPGNSYWSVGGNDDVSIWTRTLSAAEIKLIYDLSKTGYPGVLNRYRPRRTTFLFTPSTTHTTVGPWPDTNLPVVASNPVNQDHPLNQGKVGWWLALPHNMGGQFWYDLTGMWNGTLTNMGNITNGWRSSTRPGGWGHIVQDGTTSSARAITNTSSVDMSKGFTVAGWMNFTVMPVNNVGGRQCIIAMGQDLTVSAFRFTFQVQSSTSIALNVSNGTTNNNAGFTPSTLSLSTWYHFAATWNPGVAIRGYLNGVFLSQTTASIVSSINSSGFPITIGSQNGGRYEANGAIDDVCLWNRILSDVEIRSLYDLSRTGYPGALNRLRPRASTLSDAAPPPPPIGTAVPWHLFFRKAV